MAEHLKEPFAFVIFGGSGDLSRKKLIPALYHLADMGYMPDKYAVLGTSRSALTDDEYRKIVLEAIQQHQAGEEPAHPLRPEKLLPFVYYQSGDTNQPDTFTTLKAKLDHLDNELELH